MKTEQAMQITLLLGRFAVTLEEQLCLVTDFPETFETGWACALQEDSLRRALLSLNMFLHEHGQGEIGPVSFTGGTLSEWQEVLRARLLSTEALCQKTREQALCGDVLLEDIFPELEAGI